MNVTETKLPGLLLLEPDVYEDPRGFFMETWNEKKYSDLNLPRTFVQDNLSFSKKGVLRGLHFQNPQPQGKLVSVLSGKVFDVVVDLRRESATYKKWFGIQLSSENKKQLYIPEGLAHGFLTVSHEVLLSYKCTRYYDPECEWTLLWNDPELSINWPTINPLISDKDAAGRSLRELELSGPLQSGSTPADFLNE